MNNPTFEMYYDQSQNRSPTSQRQTSLHRQTSRQQFESYGHLASGLYTAEDHAAARYDSNKFMDMRNATIGGYGGVYDMGGQAWGAGAYNTNGTLNGLGGTGLRKPPSRGGRSGIPNVCIIHVPHHCPRFVAIADPKPGLDRSTTTTTDEFLPWRSRWDRSDASRCRWLGTGG